MKKLLLILVAVTGLSFAANARGTELQLGYGGYTQMDATDMHGGYGKVKSAWGALTAGINFNVLPNLWIGPSYTFSSSEFKHHDDDNLYYHVIMLNGRYAYYRTNVFKMYAHLGVGADITHISSEDHDSENRAISLSRFLRFALKPEWAAVCRCSESLVSEHRVCLMSV